VRKQNLFFRIWFYFRNGWSTYFAFIFAAINTLTVTYFLAIENYPTLSSFFPNFLTYVIIICSIGAPLLIGVGYLHFKKGEAFKSETDIVLEVNRYFARHLVNSELSLKFEKILLDLVLKMDASATISDKDKQMITDFLKEYEEHTKSRTLHNTLDAEYFKKLERLKALSK
jgi:hypothetical protein